MPLSRIVSDTERDIGRKSRFFHIAPALDAPDKGDCAVAISPQYFVWGK